MKSKVDRVARFVDDIVRNRRPSRFPAGNEEGRALQAAAMLRARQPGADLPTQSFIADLEARLRSAPSRRRDGILTRRSLLKFGGAAAAGLAAGVAIDRTLVSELPDTKQGQADLAVQNGEWVAVMSASNIPVQQAVRFSAPAIEGFVINRGGKLEALSAVCTHLGCILRFNATDRSLACPCHGAAFSLAGIPINREYLKPLPRIQSRVRNGMIEVMAGRSSPSPPATGV